MTQSLQSGEIEFQILFRNHKGAVIGFPVNLDLININSLLDFIIIVPAIPLRQILVSQVSDPQLFHRFVM